MILELARELRLPIDERPVPFRELFDVDELFVCGTTTDVQPIIELDGRPIAHGKPGEFTVKLREGLAERLYGQKVRA